MKGGIKREMRLNKRVAMLLFILAVAACRKSGSRGAAGGGPMAPELDAYVSNAGNVRMGMTEDEVSSALGGKSTRRLDAAASDGITEVAWDNIAGSHPGAAVGRFVQGNLIQIDFATAATTMPRISDDVARSLETAEVVQRAVAETLTLGDIERVTGSPGFRARWTFSHRPPNRVNASSLWAWEVEPGGRALMVEEHDGIARQPVVREMKK